MRVYVIAEAGVNHNGSVELALQLVDKAKEAGADCVKFQTFKTEKLVSKDARKAAYQIRNTNDEAGQYAMLKKLELTEDDFIAIKKHCDAIGIEFLSTAFDSDSVDFLRELGCKRCKIPSGEVTDYPYLVACARMQLPIILSTGMCTYEDIDACLDVLKANGASDITILHCTTEYPAPLASVNLNAMTEIKERYGYPVGYSDHTQGIEVSLYAVAMGATVIEKHFTLDKNMEGPDHKASLDPVELKTMIRKIREIEVLLGNGKKERQDVECGNAAVARKSIVAKRKIRKGEIFSEDNITTKRPGTGISPMLWNAVLGTSAIRDFEADEPITMQGESR